MPVIYHVTALASWTAASAAGQYTHPSLAAEGFIHCSQDHQVAGVLERYFRDETGLVKLVIDTDKLTVRWVEEWSPSTKDHFPHIYGAINLDAITDVVMI